MFIMIRQTCLSVVNEFRAVLFSPRYVGLGMTGGLTGQAHVGPFTGHHSVRRPFVHYIGRNCGSYMTSRPELIKT